MSFAPIYDLSKLTEQQKQDYIKSVCEHLQIPPELNLVRLIWSDDPDGTRHLAAYVLRGGTDIIRDRRNISVIDLKSQPVSGSMMFIATGKDSNGRTEIAVGSKDISGLTGKQLDDSIMTSQTRAIRRMTLQFVGGGLLDESEISSSSGVSPASQLTAAPQPVALPSEKPGSDITAGGFESYSRSQPLPAELIIKQVNHEELRAEVIAELNKSAEPEQPKKPRKPRGPNKPKVDLGPSEPAAPVVQPDIKPDIVQPIIQTTIAPPTPTAQPKPDIIPVITKPRLAQEQLMPFRQRMYRVVNDYLEPNGLAPQEGYSVTDKMRMLAQVTLGITNMNELGLEQWEKFLKNLEDRVSTAGPIETVKYIQETIGL